MLKEKFLKNAKHVLAYNAQALKKLAIVPHWGGDRKRVVINKAAGEATGPCSVNFPEQLFRWLCE